MDSYKKERSSRHHMKIEVGQSGNSQQDEVFTLANPMTYGDITTPTSPPTQPASRPGGQGESNPATPTATSHSSGFSRTFERLSLKSKGKNQSFFKFFNRSNDKSSAGLANGGGVADRTGGGVARKRASANEEELAGDGSSGSDHDEAFSPHSSGSSSDMRTTRQHSEPPKSPSSSIEVYATLPRQPRRHHSGGHYSRDSGFSSERESVTHVRITPQTSLNTEDDRVSPSEDVDYQPAGMEALDILQDQLQLLVKRDRDEETDSVDIYEQIINRLSSQLEEQSVAMDVLKQAESNLRLSLRLAEQRAMEAETEKAMLLERCVWVQHKYDKLYNKYKRVKSAREEPCPLPARGSKSPAASHLASPRHSLPCQPTASGSTANSTAGEGSSTSTRSPPQRVQSQTLYDRKQKMVEPQATPLQRPSTAQGFHNDQMNGKMLHVAASSLSHTETCV